MTSLQWLSSVLLRQTKAELSSFLTSIGATEVNVQNAETGWWLGRYDKEQKLFEGQSETVSA